MMSVKILSYCKKYIEVSLDIMSYYDFIAHPNFNSNQSHIMKEDMNSFLQYPVMSTLSPNKLDNAAGAVNGGGEISIQTRRDDNQTVVEIIDNGAGIPPQNRSHIFEPFFTTKEGYTQEREKLIQLGAMAAGLAHELNNPATAARRAAADLRQSVEKVQHYACELNETLSVEQWQQLVATSQEAVHCATSQPKLNSFEQSDREEAIECWLDSQNVADAWELAPCASERPHRSGRARSFETDRAGARSAKCNTVARSEPHHVRLAKVHLAQHGTYFGIGGCGEVLLVQGPGAMAGNRRARGHRKRANHPRSQAQECHGHPRLCRTLPRLCAYGGELNQVWTNLIDNAIYASGGTGRIDVRTRRDGEFFLVEIADNGSGIPPEARPHIFAVPFFTTKGGSGTGLGLVISHRIVVERHHGKIDFSTGPDGTQFNMRLPFESPAHA